MLGNRQAFYSFCHRGMAINYRKEDDEDSWGTRRGVEPRCMQNHEELMLRGKIDKTTVMIRCLDLNRKLSQAHLMMICMNWRILYCCIIYSCCIGLLTYEMTWSPFSRRSENELVFSLDNFNILIHLSTTQKSIWKKYLQRIEIWFHCM